MQYTKLEMLIELGLLHPEIINVDEQKIIDLVNSKISAEEFRDLLLKLLNVKND